MTEEGFWANGKKYRFNLGLGNLHSELQIHGVLGNLPRWRVTAAAADGRSAHATSRLADGVLEVRLTVANLSSQPMPLMVGFHPYYRIPDIPHDEWVAHIPARQCVAADTADSTGEFKPMDLLLPLPLKGRTLDDGFIYLERDSSDRAHFCIEATGRRVEAMFGPKYPAAVVWEPAPPAGQTRIFICFEPMTAIASGVNLAHKGKYGGMQSVPAGGR